MRICCFHIRRSLFRRRRNRNDKEDDAKNGERKGRRVRWRFSRFWIRRPNQSGFDRDGEGPDSPLLEKNGRSDVNAKGEGKKEGKRGIFRGIRSRISRVFKRSQNKETSTTGSDADQEPDDVMPPLEEEKWDVGMKWEPTEILSRDRTVILQTNVFYGSYDQFSDRVQGLGACSILALTIAQEMIIHPTAPLSKEQFDDLIISGANEWNRMCPLYKIKFPDGHLDLETALTARTCELEQATSKSFTGFHMPDNLEIIPPEFAEYISSGLTFGEIWSGMETLLQSSQGPLFYIVNFANHFFVLRLEKGACFIIDSMGGRLDEKCNRAHIIKFSDESLLYREGVDIVRGREACRLHIERLITQSFLGDTNSMRGWSMEALMHKFQLEFTCVEHKAARPIHHSDPPTFSGLDKQKFCRGETSASNDSDRMMNSEAEKKKGDKQAEEQEKLKYKMNRLNWLENWEGAAQSNRLQYKEDRLNWLQNWEGVAHSNRLQYKEGSSTIDFRTGQVLRSRTENVKPKPDSAIKQEKLKADSSRKQENARPELNSDSVIKQEYAGLKRKTDSAIKQKNARPETNSNSRRKPVIRHAAEKGLPGEKDSDGTQQKDVRSVIPLIKGFSPDAVHGTKRRVKPHFFSTKCPFESRQKNPVCSYILSQQLEKTKANFKKDPSKEPGLKSSPQRLSKEVNFEKDPSKESNLQSSPQRLSKEVNFQRNQNICPLNVPQSFICKEKRKSQNQKGFSLTSAVMPPVHPSRIPYPSACLPVKAKKLSAACENQTVISHQLRRLERKLKGCEEFKKCVLKECEGPFNWAHPPRP